jgi:HD-GYP domain-containing protein (c-di-GMP phosphodiesterase class II)
MLDYDETRYLTDDRYSEMVRAKRLQELTQELKSGNLSWDVLQDYISEINREIKSDILDIVKTRIESGDPRYIEGALEVLLPLITDGDEDIRGNSRRIVHNVVGPQAQLTADVLLGPKEDPTDPLSTIALVSMARMVDSKTGRENHSLRIAEIASRIAEKLEDPELDPLIVHRVALAHDIGFLELDDSIIKKAGKLTARQFSTIKTHTERSIRLFQYAELPKIFIDGMKYHHERLDGSGYPEGLAGDDIPKVAKLLAVADVFEAITSKRSHRRARSLSTALKMLEELAGKSFDSDFVQAVREIFMDEKDSRS